MLPRGSPPWSKALDPPSEPAIVCLCRLHGPAGPARCARILRRRPGQGVRRRVRPTSPKLVSMSCRATCSGSDTRHGGRRVSPAGSTRNTKSRYFLWSIGICKTPAACWTSGAARVRSAAGLLDSVRAWWVSTPRLLRSGRLHTRRPCPVRAGEGRGGPVSRCGLRRGGAVSRARTCGSVRACHP